MPQASTWLDLVVGVDVHVEMVPTPAGPVPLPFPLPFLGLTGDPAGAAMGALQDALVSLASGGSALPSTGAVLVNGLPATTTATPAKNNLALIHLAAPPGSAFARPPDGDAKLPMGALTVAFGGANAIRMGDPAFSCSDPVRLPTSTVVALPKGRQVVVGGPPGIDPAQALGEMIAARAVRTAWGAAAGLFKYLGRLTPTRLRNLIPRAMCFFTGHPVDVATGRVMTWSTDFELPGPVPLVFSRDYASSWAGRSGALGPGWSHSLDRAVWMEPGRIVARIADGREVVFAAGELAKLPPGAGRSFRDAISKFILKRTASGWTLTSPDGGIDEFEAMVGDALATDERWGMTRVVATGGRGKARIRYSYDGDARLTAIRDSVGRVVRFINDSQGRLTSVLLPDPIHVDRWLAHLAFTYSGAGDLVEVKDALGNAARYVYDAHLLVKETDRNGLSFHWIYDGRSSHARCVRTWGDGGIYDSVIDYGERFSVVSDSYNRATLYRTNEVGGVIEIRDPAGNTSKREYDAELNLVVEIDPLGRTTRTSYTATGRPTVILTPDGERVAIKYHRKMPELPALYQNQAAAIWRRNYDRAGHPTKLIGPLGGESTFEWKDDSLVAVVEPGRRRTEHTNRNGGPVLTRLPSGGEIGREFDLRGRLVSVTEPSGARTTFEYDLLDRITQVNESDGTVRTLAYDGEGNLTVAADQTKQLRLSYTGFNWLVERDDGGDLVRFGYDREGRTIEVRNERGHAFTMEYDLCGRLARQVGFDMQRTSYLRDRAGRPIEITDGKGSTKVTYDVMDRIVEKEFPDGKKATFAYRQDGALVAATNEATSVMFARDAEGNITQEIAGDQTITSTYSTAGERIALQSSLGAHIEIDRGLLGEPRAIYMGAVREPLLELRLQHDPLGREVTRSSPSVFSATWDHDPSGRPRTRAVKTETNHWSRSYDWAVGDQLRTIDDSRFGRSTFSYDGRGRLFSAINADGATAFRAPDPLGNLYKTPDRNDRRFVRGGVIRSDGNTSYAFDPAGNLSLKILPAVDGSLAPHWTYEWDGAGCLTKVVRPDEARIEFKYDAFGRRISKIVDGVETRAVWDGDTLLHELRANAPLVTWYHQPDGFDLIARFEAGKGHHIVSDHAGTPTAIYDDAGRRVWQAQLGIYGDLLGVTGDNDRTFCPWRWPGQYEDAETGLYYNRFRYYDPELGRYISQDPIGLAGGPLLYAYVTDPSTAIDPFGLINILVQGSVTVKAFPSTEIGGTEHRPLHVHVWDGQRQTRVLMQDWTDAGRLKGRRWEVYPGDREMTKNMKRVIEKHGAFLEREASSVFSTGAKCSR